MVDPHNSCTRGSTETEEVNVMTSAPDADPSEATRTSEYEILRLRAHNKWLRHCIWR